MEWKRKSVELDPARALGASRTTRASEGGTSVSLIKGTVQRWRLASSDNCPNVFRSQLIKVSFGPPKRRSRHLLDARAVRDPRLSRDWQRREFTAARSRCRCRPRGGCRVTRSSPSWPSSPACLSSHPSASGPLDSTGRALVSRNPSPAACRSDRFWWRRPNWCTASEDSLSSTSIERSGWASAAWAGCKRRSHKRHPPSAETEMRPRFPLLATSVYRWNWHVKTSNYLILHETFERRNRKTLSLLWKDILLVLSSII